MNHNLAKTCLLTLAAVLLCAAPAAAFDFADYYPLSMGNVWEYDRDRVEVYDDVLTFGVFDGVKVAGDSIIDNSYAYIYTGPERVMIVGRYDAVNQVYHDLSFKPMVLSGRTVNIGDDWVTDYDIGPLAGITFISSFVGTADITTPAGEFDNTLKYEVEVYDADGCDYGETLYFADGVGPVKISRDWESPGNCTGCFMSCGAFNWQQGNGTTVVSRRIELEKAVVDGQTYSSQRFVVAPDDPSPITYELLSGVEVHRHRLYALAGEQYAIQTSPSAGLNILLQLFDTDSATLLGASDSGGAGQGEQIAWTCPSTGVYLLKVQASQQAPRQSSFGKSNGSGTYSLEASTASAGSQPGFVSGVVRDTDSWEAVEGAQITLQGAVNRAGLSAADGSFVIVVPPDNYDIAVSASGYATYAAASWTTVAAAQSVVQDLGLQAATGASYVHSAYLPYLAYSSAFASGVAVSNAGNAAQNDVRITYFANDGTQLGQQTAAIPAGGQTAFGVSISTAQAGGWALVESALPVHGLALIMGADGSPMIDLDLKANLHTTLVLSHLATEAGKWASTAMLANPGSAAATASLTYLDASGQASAPANVIIPASGAAQVNLDQLFPGHTNGSVRISSTQPVTGFMRYDGTSQNTYWKAGLSAVPEATGSAGTYTYTIPFMPFTTGTVSGIALSNAGNSAQNILTVRHFTNDGQQLAQEILAVPANGQTAWPVTQTASQDGWTHVTTSLPLSGMALILGVDGSPMVDVDLKASTDTRLVVPHVAAVANEWASRLMVCNPGSQSAVLDLHYLNASGASPYADQQIIVPAGGAVQHDLGTLFGQTLSSGSVLVDAERPVAAFLEFDGQFQSRHWKAGLSVAPR